MMSILTSNANRDNDNVEGFGRRWDNKQYYPDNLRKFIGANTGAGVDYGGIAP